jgi:uncharacterized membrane protein
MSVVDTTFFLHGTKYMPLKNAKKPLRVIGSPYMSMDGINEKGLAWLSYVGLLFLIPLFARKDSEYCKFHVKEGATLFAVDLAYLIVKSILLLIIDLPTRTYYYGFYIHSGLYHVFNILFSLGYIFLVVVSIMGIVRAATGKKLELPLIGKIPFIKTLMDKIYASINK